MLIPPRAAEGEIARDGWSTMLLGDNVVDFEWRVVESLWHTAVFAAVPCSAPDVPHECCFHERLRRTYVFSV